MSYVIILGDVHLGKGQSIGKSGIGANLNSRIVDQLNLLDWTLDQAIENHVDDIIITGDVFEEPKPHPSLITLFMAWLKKCQVYDVNVHVIMGNHDIIRSGFVYSSPLDIIAEAELDNVQIYKDMDTVMIGSTAFTLVPFRDRKSFSAVSNSHAIELLRESFVYELACIPITYHKVLIGHLAIEGSIPVGDEIDDMTNELFCPINMFYGYDCVWMGHVHKPQVMHKKNPYIAHIGSMDISNFVETDQKKYIVIINCDDASWYTEFLPTRLLKKISVIVPKDTKDTTDYVIKEIEKNHIDLNKSIVKIEVSLSAPELKSINKTSIEKFLLGQGAFNIAGILESKKISLIKKNTSNTIDTKMDVASTIKTYAQTYVDVSARDSFIDLSMDIYSAYKIESKE